MGARSMRIVCKLGCAPLLAVLLLGGCVNDVPVQPDAVNLHWDRVPFPGQHRTGCIATDSDGRIFLGVYDYEREVALDVGTVYVSSDNGESWTRRAVDIQTLRGFAVDSEGRVYAASWDRLSRSADHGDSWVSLKRLRGQAILSVVIDAGDNIYLPTEEHGIYFSDNHGDSLKQIGQGIVAAGELYSFAVNSSGCLFAIAGDNLYRSCDRGASWIEAPNVPWDNLMFEEVAIDAEDRVFVIHGEVIYRSTDGGETWTALDPPENYYVRHISIDRQDRLYCLFAGKAYVSSDGGDSWRLMADFWSSQIEHVASNPAGDVFFTADWGLSRSVDGGASWEMLGFTEYGPTDIAIGGDGTHYVAMECGGIYRSSGNLDSWKLFNKGFSDVRLNCLVGTRDSILLAGTWNGVYISPEDQAAWSLAWLEGLSVRKIMLLPGDSVVAYADMAIHLSADGGATWSNLGLNDYQIRALMQTADGRLYAAANFGESFDTPAKAFCGIR